MKKIRGRDLFDQLINDSNDSEVNFIPILAEEATPEVKSSDIPDVIPIMALRNTVLFPGVVMPITVGREKSLKLIRSLPQKKRIIGVLSQIDANIEEPGTSDLYKVGTVANIIKVLEMPDGNSSVILQGVSRFEIEEFVGDDPFFMAKVKQIPESIPDNDDKEYSAIVSSIRDITIKVINLSPNLPPEATFAIKNIDNPRVLVNFVSANSDIKNTDKQQLLEKNSIRERSILLLEILSRELQLLELKNDIQNKVKIDLEQQQREYFLQQQMKTIQDELGGNPIEQEIEDLKEKAKKKKWSKEIAEHFDKEVNKLQRMNPMAGEYSVQLNYVQLLLDLPWNEYTADNFDLAHAKEILDEDHFGLEQVKDRILEHLAVLKLKGDLKAPILCLYGPPGVGKTSLGKSIARALERKYARISLGGMHDEAEIRGHRKTYIGAMPGRIIQSLKKVKSSNPVIILDEIDKVGNDFHGDPSSALLEALDPEQNSTFYDNFVEVEYDLSKVLFITTANSISTINPALRDRMELIEVSGYSLEEKVEIAKRHLVPNQLKEHGLEPKKLVLNDKVIAKVIQDYTRESGVRNLNQKIAKMVRYAAKKIAFGEEYNAKLSLKDVEVILGIPRFTKEVYQGNDIAGVVTGLAWTEQGGEILFVEASLSKGKGNLTLTGNLGDVMKESAVLALEFLKSHASILNINPDVFEKWNVHIHVPEGAIPKDGPSAGVTMVTALASTFTQRKVASNLAMTGEITLRGRVLPVGGIKEKILAAKRANITNIILPEENRKDISEINPQYIKGLKFKYVSTILEVLENALLDEKVDKPLVIE
ncbi:MAG: endopeptidase La [Bacteroidales bacterium]|nr:endopeptidase La [Bacteroidales bacterium]